MRLGVVFNSAGKMRCIWAGRHVNLHEPFRMDSLQLARHDRPPQPSLE